MPIFTSYYSAMKRIKEKYPKAIFISIARYTPKWYVGIVDLKLAPSEELLKAYKDGFIDSKAYKKWFAKEQLQQLDHKQQLKQKYKKKMAVLLCYESPNRFCHRHLLDPDWEELDI